MADGNQNSVFSERLKSKLKELRMSQAELARRSGLSKSTISHYVKGDWKGKQDAVYAIAGVLRCNAEWLLGYDNRVEDAVCAQPIEEIVERLLQTLGYSFDSGDYGSKIYMAKGGAAILPDYSMELGLFGGRISAGDKDVLINQIIAHTQLLANRLLTKGMEFELRKKIDELNSKAAAAKEIGNLQAYTECLALKDHTREMLIQLLDVAGNL